MRICVVVQMMTGLQLRVRTVKPLIWQLQMMKTHACHWNVTVHLTLQLPLQCQKIAHVLASRIPLLNLLQTCRRCLPNLPNPYQCHLLLRPLFHPFHQALHLHQNQIRHLPSPSLHPHCRLLLSAIHHIQKFQFRYAAQPPPTATLMLCPTCLTCHTHRLHMDLGFTVTCKCRQTVQCMTLCRWCRAWLTTVRFLSRRLQTITATIRPTRMADPASTDVV